MEKVSTVPVKVEETVREPDPAPIPERSPEQKFYDLGCRMISDFCYKVDKFKGSKKQLQQMLTNLAKHQVAEDQPTWSYPGQQQELFDAWKNVEGFKLTLYLMGLESHGKIKMIEQVSVNNEDKKEA